MQWQKFAGRLVLISTFTLFAGCTRAPKATTHPAVAAAPSTAPATQPVDEDIAALEAALDQIPDATVQHDHGTVSVPGAKDAEADRFVVTFPKQTLKITLWILSPESSAAVAKWRTLHHERIDRDLWDDRTYLIRDDAVGFTGNARRNVERCLSDSSGPLGATIITGPGGLELELRNRSAEPIKVFRPYADVPAQNPAYRVWQDKFGTEVDGYAELRAFRQESADVIDLDAGKRVAWPMRIELGPETDSKVDAEFFFLEVNNHQYEHNWVHAPTVRVHCDADGRYTITPWKPTPLSPAESATSQRLSAFTEQWAKDVSAQLDHVADTPPRFSFIHDAAGHVTDVHFALVYHSADGVLSLRLDASREGDLHGLAIADTVDPIKWDGHQSERAYRVPGSDWILRADTGPGVPPEIRAAIDDCFNAFLKVGAQK